jgi:hypothetical protein
MRVCPLISGLGDGTPGKECDPDSDWEEESGMCWTCEQPGHRRQCCSQNVGAEIMNEANRSLSTLGLGGRRHGRTVRSGQDIGRRISSCTGLHHHALTARQWCGTSPATNHQAGPNVCSSSGSQSTSEGEE